MAGGSPLFLLLLLLSISYVSLSCDNCCPSCPSPPRHHHHHHHNPKPRTPCPPPFPTPIPPTPPYSPPYTPPYMPPTPTPTPPTPTPRPPTPTPPTPTPTPRPPTPGPPGQPGPPGPAYCPIDALKLNACVDVLGGLIHIGIGREAKDKCCPLIQGIADLDAALCLCTIIRAKLLNIKLYLPIALELLITCGKYPPPGFQCPPLH